MNKLLLIAILIPSICFSQTEKAQSNIETIAEKPGVFYKKEFTRMGDYYYGYVEVVKITNVVTKNVIKGIRIGLDKTWGFLDEDEIDGLIASLAKMKEIVTTPIPKDYTEYLFTSRSGFRASVFVSSQKWVFSIKADKNTSSSSALFDNAERFQSFYDMIVAAKKVITQPQEKVDITKKSPPPSRKTTRTK